MASGAIAGGAVSKTKHKRSEISDKRLKPTTEVRPEKISLNSISKLEVRNLKRKLTSELEKVRSLIIRLDAVPNKKLRTANNGGKVQVFKSCNSLLTKLMKHKSGWIFNTPVDAVKSGLHDYHSIVKKPMDLGTVKSRLSKGWYESPLEFAEDVRLTFNNALLYNPVGHDVHRMAEGLLNMFEEKWAPLETQYQSLNKNPTPPRLLPTVVENRTLERAESMTKPVEPLAEKRVEEEEACGDRELTFEEKRRLSEDLQDLPFDKLEEVVQIIKKRNPELTQQDDEIELDIDSLDLETLWELYRFVTGYKESLSKRKEEHGLGLERDAESVHNSVQEPNTLVTGPESPRVTSLVQQVNAGGASSSSSGSGSSSSDSDSDSSGHGS